MKKINFSYHEACEDQYGTIYLFGRDGYIDVIDGVAVAHIFNKTAKLRTPSFSDLESELYNEAQEITVSKTGLPSMIEHLKVPASYKLQKRTFERRQSLAKYGAMKNSEIIE